jgi:hypothetical protein
MNVIIQPLSQQAWTRVETRVLEHLLNDDTSREFARQRSRLRWPCEVAHALISVRRRIRSWLDLISDYGRGRASTEPAPDSGVRWRAGSVTGARIAIPSR